MDNQVVKSLLPGTRPVYSRQALFCSQLPYIPVYIIGITKQDKMTPLFVNLSHPIGLLHERERLTEERRMKLLSAEGVILGSHVTAMNTQKAGQMRVKAMCFLSYLMRTVCFHKAQAPDYGHKKAMVFPLSLVTRPFIRRQNETLNLPLVFGL